MVDKSGQRVRQMFGEIAPRYDLMNHLLSLNVDRYWRRRTVQSVPASQGPVLDLCTGTGDLALAYHTASGGGVRIIGADFCHEMLELGRQKALRAGADAQVRFVEADAQHLPFSNDTFGLVCVAFGLRNVQDTGRGLREMVRVCRPGGRVAVLEFSMPRRQPFRAVYRWYFRHVLPRIGGVIARNRYDAYSYLPASVGDFPDGAALADLMRAAGLTDVCFTPLTLGIATLYVGTAAAKDLQTAQPHLHARDQVAAHEHR